MPLPAPMGWASWHCHLCRRETSPPSDSFLTSYLSSEYPLDLQGSQNLGKVVALAVGFTQAAAMGMPLPNGSSLQVLCRLTVGGPLRGIPDSWACVLPVARSSPSIQAKVPGFGSPTCEKIPPVSPELGWVPLLTGAIGNLGERVCGTGSWRRPGHVWDRSHWKYAGLSAGGLELGLEEGV